MTTRFDPRSAEFIAHPYDVYAELRADAPVVFHEATGQWLVSRHADVSALLRDRRLGRTYTHRFGHEEFGRTPPDPAHEPFHTLNGNGLLDLEGPDHTRIRRLVAKAFTRGWSRHCGPPWRGWPTNWSPGCWRRAAAT